MRKSILSLGLMLVFSFAMFLGTTYAWWNDNTVVENNVISAGNLDVAFIASDTADFSNPVNLEDEGAKLIDFTNIQPGSTMTKYVKITNSGSVDVAYKLQAISNLATEATQLPDDLDVHIVIPGLVNQTLTARQILQYGQSMPFGTLAPGASVTIQFSITLNPTKATVDRGEFQAMDFNINLIAQQATQPRT